MTKRPANWRGSAHVGRSTTLIRLGLILLLKWVHTVNFILWSFIGSLSAQWPVWSPYYHSLLGWYTAKSQRTCQAKFSSESPCCSAAPHEFATLAISHTLRRRVFASRWNCHTHVTAFTSRCKFTFVNACEKVASSVRTCLLTRLKIIRLLICGQSTISDRRS